VDYFSLRNICVAVLFIFPFAIRLVREPCQVKERKSPFVSLTFCLRVQSDRHLIILRVSTNWQQWRWCIKLFSRKQQNTQGKNHKIIYCFSISSKNFNYWKFSGGFKSSSYHSTAALALLLFYFKYKRAFCWSAIVLSLSFSLSISHYLSLSLSLHYSRQVKYCAHRACDINNSSSFRRKEFEPSLSFVKI
jgi:hypothetical protein